MWISQGYSILLKFGPEINEGRIWIFSNNSCLRIFYFIYLFLGWGVRNCIYVFFLFLFWVVGGGVGKSHDYSNR